MKKVMIFVQVIELILLTSFTANVIKDPHIDLTVKSMYWPAIIVFCTIMYNRILIVKSEIKAML